MENWKNSATIILWIWIACAFIIAMIVFVILIAKNYTSRIMIETQKRTEIEFLNQKELLHNELVTQEKERERIAMDLHDNLISELNVIRILVSQNENKLTVSKRLSELATSARRVSHDLTPPLIEVFNLLELIESYTLNLKSHLKFHIYSVSSEKKTEAKVKLHLFRIIQELINNTLKHANAHNLLIEYRGTDRRICIRVTDDGNGIQRSKKNGLGLRNIASRSQFLNAKHRFESTPEKGTIFLIVIPLKPYKDE